MSLVTGLAAYLAAAGVGTWHEDGSAYATGEVGLCVEYEPEAPDRTVTLTTFPGEEADSLLPYDEPRIRVRTRGDADPRTSLDLCQAVYDQVHGLGPLVLPGGTRLQLAVGLTSGPYYVGRDANGRHRHATTFRCEITNPTAHRM